ncbi:Glycerol-3-phosphate dehydrogenase, partial [Lamprotornis superbus]
GIALPPPRGRTGWAAGQGLGLQQGLDGTGRELLGADQMCCGVGKAVKGTALIGGGAIATVFGLSQFSQYRNKHGALVQVQAAEGAPVRKEHLPSREQQIQALQSSGEFDVLVIGGGATGCGCALDAATRGLKTALLERDDFSSGTSSRSTKLIHGGVRYLQKAIMKLDFEQYRMVKEALEERAHLLQSAPHLSAPLPIMLPIYKWWQLPYYWVGIKLYDLVAGSQCLKSSYVLTKARALELFPMLRRDKLVGAIVYYDDTAQLCSVLGRIAENRAVNDQLRIPSTKGRRCKHSMSEFIFCVLEPVPRAVPTVALSPGSSGLLPPPAIHNSWGRCVPNRAGVVFITSFKLFIQAQKNRYIINVGSTSKSKSQPCPGAIPALPEHGEAKAYGCPR